MRPFAVLGVLIDPGTPINHRGQAPPPGRTGQSGNPSGQQPRSGNLPPRKSYKPRPTRSASNWRRPKPRRPRPKPRPCPSRPRSRQRSRQAPEAPRNRSGRPPRAIGPWAVNLRKHRRDVGRSTIGPVTMTSATPDRPQPPDRGPRAHGPRGKTRGSRRRNTNPRGGDSGDSSDSDEPGGAGPQTEGEAERGCLHCSASIDHLAPQARFCDDAHSQRFRPRRGQGGRGRATPRRSAGVFPARRSRPRRPSPKSTI